MNFKGVLLVEVRCRIYIAYSVRIEKPSVGSDGG
jgi:hypothetical protein